MPIQSLDSFMSPALIEAIEHAVCGPHFAWYWRDSSTYYDERAKDSKDFQFVHTIYADNEVKSDAFGLAREVLFAFENVTGQKIKDVMRIKANLTVPSTLSEKDLDDAIHIDTDIDGNYLSIVYYVMDSDGDTILCDENKQHVGWKSPKKGSAFFFPSNQWHRHTPPKHHKRRVVLNFVVELE